MPQRVLRPTHVLAAALMGSAVLAAPQPSDPAVPLPEIEVHAPAASPVWADDDSAARPFRDADPGNERLLARLDERLVAHPGDVAARSTRAWLRAQDGDRAGAAADLAVAVAAAESDRDIPTLRRVLWSAGWTAVALGDGALANTYWDRNLELTGKRPAWVPYSRAVAHALIGDYEAASAWVGMAAAMQPRRLASREALIRSTRHWQPAERQWLVVAYDAWKDRERGLHGDRSAD